MENLTTLSDKERQAYIELTKQCCSSDNQKLLIPFFEKLNDFSDDEEYMTTLNYVMEYCDENNSFFIMSLDAKQDIETLEWRLENSLKKNFNLSMELPNPLGYGERASVSYDNVLEDYDKPLREQGLQIGFIDTRSDEYVIFIHQVAKENIIENVVNDLGYNYYDLTDKKRNNIIKEEHIVKEKFDRTFFLFWLVVLILCLFSTYVIYRGYIKEGISFMVGFLAVFNVIFYYLSISVLLEEWKKER